MLPEGPYQDQRFRCDRQPYAGLFFDGVDSGLYRRFAALGPTQSGKTLTCCVIPTLWHLFEWRESVVLGLPDMDMAEDKWQEDFLPVIEQTRYREWLPRRGGGSRGGFNHSIRFSNGATLRFMSGGGNDKSRAGFTARVIVITEVDGFAITASTSVETDKVSQIIARSRAYGQWALVYLECTVTVEKGRIWQEYTKGTASRIVYPCPHCAAGVALERKDLHGFEEASDELEAAELAAFHCAECGEQLDETQRREANLQAVLVHRGQLYEAGQVVGDPPRTATFGFRWSGFNNLFASCAELGAEEWQARRNVNEDAAERKQKQFVWAEPYTPPQIDEVQLTPEGIAARMYAGHPRLLVPADTWRMTVGVDLGKRLLHWLAICWRPYACGHIVAYGREEVPSDDMQTERALLVALNNLHDQFETGFPRSDDENRRPDLVYIDAGWMPDVVRTFLVKHGQRRYRACVGRGETQMGRIRYARPKKASPNVLKVGEGYHVAQQADGVLLAELNADQWKTWLHRRLATPLVDEHGEAVERPGAMTLYSAGRNEHLSLTKHLTAEREVDDFTPERGAFKRFERESRVNHWLDSGMMACAAGHAVGVRLIDTPQRERSSSPRSTQPTRRAPRLWGREGRPFITQRER